MAGLGEGSRQGPGLGEAGSGGRTWLAGWAGLLQAELAGLGRAVSCLAESSTEGCQGAGPWEEAWEQVLKARSPVEAF